ncbi:type II secretion system protein GspL [Ramlibacter sp. 2FC]|uniref:type II secretion system protein GspL n=1 Tax=Ramlibacter sp. 2FC TaxID=2502188 RepID=UPI0010FA2510|nr:type II secretion system protein GspL [Ramlibacter sp. 2FC]
MSSLILTLPASDADPQAGYAYALTPDGQQLGSHASAPAALLPAPGRGGEVVAVVPAGRLSWHSVELPRGVGPGSTRLRPVLESLLEDRLLDEPEQLHLALAPDASAGARAWVAACDRAWLRGHLQALEAAQRPVARIVPELAPATGPTQCHAVGEPGQASLLLTGEAAGGTVLVLPLSAAALSLAAPEIEAHGLLTAEPGLAAETEQLLQRKAELRTQPQRALLATQSAWDLAQFEFGGSGRHRAARRLAAAWQDFRHAAAWRPARWGLALLLLAQLAGLNAWAWRTEAAMKARQAAIRDTLSQTFPQVRLVVDAPLQMAREVAALRQATGATSGRDLEAMLAALGQALPPGQGIGAIEYSAGAARFKGLQLGAAELGELGKSLRPLGYQAHAEGDSLLLQAAETSP